VAPGVYLVRGAFVPGQQPDGNSVIFRAPGSPEGGVVVDTGRHREHTEAVMAKLAALGLTPRAVVNSHWHLDHIGGNVLFRERFPGIRVYASAALAEARTGFLASYRQQLDQMVASDRPSAAEKDAFRREMALIDAGPKLAPDEVVSASGKRVLAGLPLEIHLEERAVTGGDLWIYDPASRVLVAGDLVTLPAPFLDTACPSRWAAVLARLEKVEWDVLVPGHGPPMKRADLATYRTAFDGLLACAASKEPAESCIDGWIRDGGELVRATDTGHLRELLDYYVTVALRGDAARTAKLCGT